LGIRSDIQNNDMKRAIILITAIFGICAFQSCTSAEECGAYAQHDTEQQPSYDDVQ
jgi:hypothetical protein